MLHCIIKTYYLVESTQTAKMLHVSGGEYDFVAAIDAISHGNCRHQYHVPSVTSAGKNFFITGGCAQIEWS